MKVPRFEARAMPVRPTTLCTPTMAITETATTRATSAMWGVLKSGWMKERPEGNSRESAMPAVMRMAVFMADKRGADDGDGDGHGHGDHETEADAGDNAVPEELHEVADGRARCGGSRETRGRYLVRHVDELVAHHVACGKVLEKIGDDPLDDERDDDRLGDVLPRVLRLGG